MSPLGPAGSLGTQRTEIEADADSLLGMTILLGAWVMLFAALFLAYGVVRVQAPEWPPFGAPRLPRVAPALNTLLLLASSLTLRRGLSLARRAGGAGPGGRPGAWLAATLVLGAGFLAAQIAMWMTMRNRGLFPSSGVYGSVFYALTGFHALHVLAGVVALAVVAVNGVGRRRDGLGSPGVTLRPLSPARIGPARLVALYWDFIAAIWVLMYLAIYLL